MKDDTLIKLFNSEDNSNRLLGIEYLRAISKENGRNVLEMFYEVAEEAMITCVTPFMKEIRPYSYSAHFIVLGLVVTFCYMPSSQTWDFCIKDHKWYSDFAAKHKYHLWDQHSPRKYIRFCLHKLFNTYLGKV